MSQRASPGPCPICGAAHSACTPGDTVIAVSQLPARDHRFRTHDEILAAVQAVSPTAVSTKTYKRQTRS